MMHRGGQSIVEVLIAVAVGAFFIIGAAAVIAPALQTNKQVVQVQAKTQLAKELADNVRGWAAGNWSGLLSLATGTGNAYYLNTTSSPFAAVATSGMNIESVTIATTTYQRYFYLNDVYRDSNGNVTTTASGNNFDPSTKLITIIIQGSTSAIATATYNMYLTRNQNGAFNQKDWSGGSGQNGPVTFVSSTFASATSVVSSVAGQLQLGTPAGGTCTL